MSDELNSSAKAHHLKVWPQFYPALLDESKPFEARKDDRDFNVGDLLVLEEWSPNGGYTGSAIRRTITYILRGTEHVARGYCILGLSRAAVKERGEDTEIVDWLQDQMQASSTHSVAEILGSANWTDLREFYRSLRAQSGDKS